MDGNYVDDLENFVKRILTPMKNLPFNVIIKSISGCKVLPFKKDSKLIDSLEKSFNDACASINKNGILSNRPNEVGNKIEPYIKASLNKFGLMATTPYNRDGNMASSGYPDILFEFDKKYFYLECKTYNVKNYNSSLRSFYFSPSDKFKVTKDAPHLMVSFEILYRNGKYYTKHWKLYSLENLKVDLKHEFNQSNKKLYGDQSCLDLILEGEIK